MNIQQSTIFVFHFTEEDVYVFVRVLEVALGVGPSARRPLTEAERAVLLAHYRELSRTLDTAHDDDGLEAGPGSIPSAAAGRPARPVCPVHQQPMWHQQGKHGWFWSCHVRNADGSYCTYRPAQT